jgi:hypothetical protein
MLKRHEVEILLKAGHRKAEVARLTGVSLCSVKLIAQEGPVVHVDDAAERGRRQVGRPSTVANFRKPISIFCSRRLVLRHWRFCGGCGRRAIREARRIKHSRSQLILERQMDAWRSHPKVTEGIFGLLSTFLSVKSCVVVLGHLATSTRFQPTVARSARPQTRTTGTNPTGSPKI